MADKRNYLMYAVHFKDKYEEMDRTYDNGSREGFEVIFDLKTPEEIEEYKELNDFLECSEDVIFDYFRSYDYEWFEIRYVNRQDKSLFWCIEVDADNYSITH